MSGNNGGPWGGGGNRGGDDDRGNQNGGRRPESAPQMPEIDEIVKKGQERLRVLMGGGGGRSGGGRGGDGEGPRVSRGAVGLGILAAIGLWLWASFYTVKPEEQGVELFLGEYLRTTDDGPHMAWWPLVTAEVLPVTTEQSENIGLGGDRDLMLTTDENIIDLDFQVVWNISDPAKFLFNLADPQQTVRSVSESAMREIVAESELAPLLNRARAIVASRAEDLIQQTLDSYDSGINVVRVNLAKADPPREVIDSFREVQAAEQERDRLERQADAYANRVLAGARGEAAQVLEEAEAYRAQVVNEAEGEASRFTAVLNEYQLAPEVTRRRLYIETLERVLGNVDKVILDENAGGAGQGVVPYLPLNELRRSGGNN